MTTTISPTARPAPGWRRRGAGLLLVAVAFGAGSSAILTAGGSAANAGGPVPQSLRTATPTPVPTGAQQKCSTPSSQIVHDVPWTQKRLNLSRAWEVSTGKGVVVGIIDTGVDASVPQLAGHVLPGSDIINGQGAANTDCFGHGTFVAGIVAAQHRTGTGVEGVAPGAMVLPIRQANSSSDGTSAGLAKSIRAATDGGAKVINISASAFAPSDELRAAVEYADGRDVLLVASASNEAQQGNPKAYPAAYPEVLAVGAVGQDGKRTEFSEVGDYLDLVAPGVNVISLSRGGPGHLTDNGTSYATPFVTATAALVRSYYPKLTAAQVKRRLELTADHPATALPDPQVGWGVVNPYNAVTAVLPQEYGLGAKPPHAVPLKQIHRPILDTAGRDKALTFAGGAAAMALFVVGAAYVLPRGIRRDWQPAGHASGTGKSGVDG